MRRALWIGIFLGYGHVLIFFGLNEHNAIVLVLSFRYTSTNIIVALVLLF